MSVTLQDIAEICNLSRPTISRALRDDPLIKAKTRERVHKVAKELGYHPNLFASSLRNGRSNTVFIILESLRDVVDREIVSYASDYLAAKGYDSFATFHMEKEDRYQRLVNKLFQSVADGALIVPRRLGVDFEILRKIALRGYPAVLLDVDVEGLGFPLVTTDNDAAARELVSEARKLGCGDFALLHYLPNQVARQRQEACISEIGKSKRWIGARDISAEWFKELPKQKPFAVIADSQNDILEFSSRWSKEFAGRKMIFACFDEWIGQPAPAEKVLVSIQDCKGISEAAVDLLLDLIARKGSPQGSARHLIRVKRKELKVISSTHN